MVLPWGSVCWPTTALSRTRCPERPWRHCAYVRHWWGCACHCARWSYPSTVPPRGSAVRGWHRPNALDGPQYDFAAGWRDKKMKHDKPAEMMSYLHVKIVCLTLNTHHIIKWWNSKSWFSIPNVTTVRQTEPRYFEQVYRVTSVIFSILPIVTNSHKTKQTDPTNKNFVSSLPWTHHTRVL